MNGSIGYVLILDLAKVKVCENKIIKHYFGCYFGFGIALLNYLGKSWSDVCLS